jgi:hypothetical protein
MPKPMCGASELASVVSVCAKSAVLLTIINTQKAVARRIFMKFKRKLER